ncbi:hypothetical protein KBD33_03615 [Candidatus Gracilibacteria bacterium]|nr:hypothetical protein [Candidatus Gracilibacteria bacterium]
MPTPIQSPYPNILPFLETIPKGYWKSVSGGNILLSKRAGGVSADIDTEYLYLLVYGPDLGTVSYTGDSVYPQFSEVAIGSNGQCVALAKAIAGKRSIPTEKWLPGMNLSDFCNTPESILPSSYEGLMIAYFDGKPNYALANPAKKHVAILLDIVRDANGKPKSILVIDQNYYSIPPYTQYSGKIARHTIPWGRVGSKGVAVARSYNIVQI